MKPVYTVMKVAEPTWEQVPAVTLTHTGWLPAGAVTARAQLCHDEKQLWVRLEAEESPVRATLTGPLDSICKDSCLEFFFAPQEDDDRYFNFEFNPLGALFLGYGKERATRVRQILNDPQSLLQLCPFETENGWGIVFCIPLTFIQMYFPGYEFSGKAGGNFYKCGELTEMPHYLAWSPLTSEKPDYHRRQDFGILRFEE